MIRIMKRISPLILGYAGQGLFLSGILLASISGGMLAAGADRAMAAETTLVDCGESRRISLLEWPQTDFTRCTTPLDEIISGGPGRDGIPAIDTPAFIPVTEEMSLDPEEPVISLSLNGEARAWPLRYLIWHEIANDTLGGVPVAATYCPLCNAAIVFDRRLGGKVLDFGTTGNLRKSDLVMYDRQTESWWQQYTGEAITGELAGETLRILPSRLESWAQFKARHPDGDVLIAQNPGFRPYGANPYVGYDTSPFPFLYDGTVPDGIKPLARVVVVDGKAWALDLLRSRKKIHDGDLTLTWTPGQRSVLDQRDITRGRDVGTVTARRGDEHSCDGDDPRDVPYDVTFAFVFHAFSPDGVLITE